MIEWLQMGGHGFYIWSAYAMLAAALVIEVAALHRHCKAAWRRSREFRDEQMRDEPTRGARTRDARTQDDQT